jgi:hypothetical protein
MLNGNNTSLFEFCHIETINANDKESKKKISNNNTLEDFKKDETFELLTPLMYLYPLSSLAPEVTITSSV